MSSAPARAIEREWPRDPRRRGRGRRDAEHRFRADGARRHGERLRRRSGASGGRRRSGRGLRRSGRGLRRSGRRRRPASAAAAAVDTRRLSSFAATLSSRLRAAAASPRSRPASNSASAWTAPSRTDGIGFASASVNSGGSVAGATQRLRATYSSPSRWLSMFGRWSGVTSRTCVAHVVVELANRDPAVLVAVGLAGLERLHDRAREHRRASLAGQLVALEGVLHRVGRRDDGAPAAAQVVVDVDALAGPEPQPPRDRAAVAAVEQHQHVAGTASGHLAADELGRDRRRVEVSDLGVGGGEVQLATVVLEPVAGEVQEQERVTRAVAEECGDPAP